MSDIPQQKNALIAFLRKYLLGQAAGHQPPQISATQLTASYATVTNSLTASYATVTNGLTASYATVTNQLGVGTTTPGRAFYVDDDTSAISTIIKGPGGWTYAEGSFSTNANLYLANVHSDNTAGLATSIVFNQSGTSKNRFASITLVGGTNHGSNLVFLTRTSDGVYAERMRINESGDLQFGATAGSAGGIAQESWTAVTAYGVGGDDFAEHWENYDASTYQVVGFMKDSMGFVRLRGLAKSTDAGRGITIFTLPSGYRPTLTSGFGQRADQTVMGSIYVTAAGEVQVATGETAVGGFIWLDGIIFDTR